MHRIRGGRVWNGVIPRTGWGAGPDATSPKECNLDLSNRRPQAVDAHLRALKADPERVSAIDDDNARLLFPEAPPTADNRRVAIAKCEPVKEGRR